MKNPTKIEGGELVEVVVDAIMHDGKGRLLRVGDVYRTTAANAADLKAMNKAHDATPTRGAYDRRDMRAKV